MSYRKPTVCFIHFKFLSQGQIARSYSHDSAQRVRCPAMSLHFINAVRVKSARVPILLKILSSAFLDFLLLDFKRLILANCCQELF